jgi:hypothetical protein
MTKINSSTFMFFSRECRENGPRDNWQLKLFVWKNFDRLLWSKKKLDYIKSTVFWKYKHQLMKQIYLVNSLQSYSVMAFLVLPNLYWIYWWLFDIKNDFRNQYVPKFVISKKITGLSRYYISIFLPNTSKYNHCKHKKLHQDSGSWFPKCIIIYTHNECQSLIHGLSQILAKHLHNSTQIFTKQW